VTTPPGRLYKGAPIPAGYPWHPPVLGSAEFLADAAERAYGLRSNRSALFWALLKVVADHAARDVNLPVPRPRKARSDGLTQSTFLDEGT
jgi:hypothetical protein